MLGFHLTLVASAQLITPAYVISNNHAGIKQIVTEERTAFTDFRVKEVLNYNKQGLPTRGMEILSNGNSISYKYYYDINEKDSTLTIRKAGIDEEGKPFSEKYAYRFSKGTLWEWSPVEANETVIDYKHYHYDENWNLIATNEVKVVGGDTSITRSHRYSVQTDVFHRLVSTNHTSYNMTTRYIYDEDGALLSKSIFDGQIKRSTEHRLYDEENQLELTFEVLNRTGALMSIKKYSYKNYWWSKTSIFEKWMPVAHSESVMQER